MNKILIAETSATDYRVMSGLLMRAGYDPVSTESIESGKVEAQSCLPTRLFPNVDLHVITLDGVSSGFVGLVKDKIEMLFIDEDRRGCGLGTQLINHAVNLGARLVDVNEQNPQAFGFYKSRGFHVVSRDELDEAGRPYPILHLSL